MLDLTKFASTRLVIDGLVEQLSKKDKETVKIDMNDTLILALAKLSPHVTLDSTTFQLMIQDAAKVSPTVNRMVNVFGMLQKNGMDDKLIAIFVGMLFFAVSCIESRE